VAEPLSIRRGDTFPIVRSQLFRNETDLLPLATGDTVRWVMRPLDGSTLLNGAAVIADGPNGWVEYHWAAGDLAAFPDGPALGEWFVTFASGGSITIPFPTPIHVVVGGGVADLPAISASDLAFIRSKIGPAEPPYDSDLMVLLEQYGTPQEVAALILEGRLAKIAGGPTKFTLDGDGTFDFSGSAKLLVEQVGQLRSPRGDGVTEGSLYRTDRER
jgi:hypothetical protein